MTANAVVLHPRSRPARAIVLHAPAVGPDIAISAFVLTVLVASAALLWSVLGL